MTAFNVSTLYYYEGEVSVPQTELLSLITAAKSLGIRGLADDNVNTNDIAERDIVQGI